MLFIPFPSSSTYDLYSSINDWKEPLKVLKVQLNYLPIPTDQKKIEYKFKKNGEWVDTDDVLQSRNPLTKKFFYSNGYLKNESQNNYVFLDDQGFCNDGINRIKYENNHLIIYEDNKLLFDGESFNGIPHGKGKLYFPIDGTIEYDGNFELGRYNGYGIQYRNIENCDKVLILSRNWENHLYNSDEYLREHFKEYEGFFKNGKFHGKGTLYYQNGKKLYEGDFSNGVYHKKGILYYKNGNKRYEGQFLRIDEKFSTFANSGKLYNENGSIHYEGSFRNGDFNGDGILYYESGKKKYQGDFINNTYGRTKGSCFFNEYGEKFVVGAL